MRVKHKVNVRIAEDTTMNNLLFAPSDSLSEVIRDEWDKSAGGTLNIAQGTDEDLSFGDVNTVRALYISVDQNVTVKINGSNDGITMNKGSSATYDFAKLFMEADITSVNIAAPVDADVTGKFCVWGD